jgi:hypothetical protein
MEDPENEVFGNYDSLQSELADKRTSRAVHERAIFREETIPLR